MGGKPMKVIVASVLASCALFAVLAFTVGSASGSTVVGKEAPFVSIALVLTIVQLALSTSITAETTARVPAGKTRSDFFFFFFFVLFCSHLCPPPFPYPQQLHVRPTRHTDIARALALLPAEDFCAGPRGVDFPAGRRLRDLCCVCCGLRPRGIFVLRNAKSIKVTR